MTIKTKRLEVEPMAEKFFKLPLDNFLKILSKKMDKEWVLNTSQRAMVEGLEGHRFWIHIAARRTGKSQAAAILALRKLLEPNVQVMIVAPTYTLSSIIWDYVTEMIKKLEIEVEKFNQKDKVVKLINGSVFRLLSANNRDQLVGRAAHFLIVDEAALIDNPEYFERDLRPALSTYPNSRALFISTPRGKANYLYSYFNRKDDPNYEEWGGGLFDWTANPLLNEKDILEAKATLPKSIFEQEYYCKWSIFEGQIYEVTEELILNSAISPEDRRLDYIAGLDIGYRDETAFVVIGTDGDNFYIVDEYVAKEETTGVHAQNIKEMIAKWDIQSIYIDAAAQQMRADLAYDHDIYCDNAIKDVNAGIATIQSLVAQKKVWFNTSYLEQFGLKTFTSMAAYRWNVDTEKQKPVHDEHSHTCDAVRYAIYSHIRKNVDVYSHAAMH